MLPWQYQIHPNTWSWDSPGSGFSGGNSVLVYCPTRKYPIDKTSLYGLKSLIENCYYITSSLFEYMLEAHFKSYTIETYSFCYGFSYGFKGDKTIRSALTCSILGSNIEMVKYICLNSPECINLKDGSHNEFSPLTLAIDNRLKIIDLKNELIQTSTRKLKLNYEVIQELILTGADVNDPLLQIHSTGFPKTPLTLALETKEQSLVEFLVKHGAKPCYAFSEDRKSIIKQKFVGEEKKLYEVAKRAAVISKKICILFNLGGFDEDSLIYLLPNEIKTKILLQPDVTTPFYRAITKVKKALREARAEKL